MQQQVKACISSTICHFVNAFLGNKKVQEYVIYGDQVSIITARCTIVQSAILRLHVICLSICSSVTLVDHDHVGWKSWKLIVQTISPTSLLFVAQRSSTYSQGNMEKFFGKKCSFNTYVHNVRLNWVNRESRDLRWRCGCLFTFVGASHGHLCNSTVFLFMYPCSKKNVMVCQKDVRMSFQHICHKKLAFYIRWMLVDIHCSVQRFLLCILLSCDCILTSHWSILQIKNRKMIVWSTRKMICHDIAHQENKIHMYGLCLSQCWEYLFLECLLSFFIIMHIFHY